MDPINAYLLGQIRQQEILESCQRNRWGYAETGLIASLRQRLSSAMSARYERLRAPRSPSGSLRGTARKPRPQPLKPSR